MYGAILRWLRVLAEYGGTIWVFVLGGGLCALAAIRLQARHFGMGSEHRKDRILLGRGADGGASSAAEDDGLE
jgi:hypothetical protein